MELSLGFSPCPNDTFIFDALVHHKIDTEGLEFKVELADVEQLNQSAFNGRIDITKLSYHAYAYVMDRYVLLDSGSALGNDCGPLLIARKPMSREAVSRQDIAIPGKYTTANFLLGLAYPEATRKREMLFSHIEEAVLNGRVGAGLIIHENRFTYQYKGLIKIADLGAFWEEQTGYPIPLGGIAIRRTLPPEILTKVNRVLRKSVDFALDHPDQTYDYVRQHAQEMEREVLFRHIALYVNDYTRDLGERGRRAIQHLFAEAKRKGIIPASEHALFLQNRNAAH